MEDPEDLDLSQALFALEQATSPPNRSESDLAATEEQCGNAIDGFGADPESSRHGHSFYQATTPIMYKWTLNLKIE